VRVRRRPPTGDALGPRVGEANTRADGACLGPFHATRRR
jgi:hypothetical protein